MARQPRQQTRQKHQFRHKLVLNQWLISLFGVDPLKEHKIGEVVPPIRVIAELIKDPRMEGLDQGNIHRFYHNLLCGEFWPSATISPDDLLRYEQNIVRHTLRINEKRHRSIVWKYFQWLSLLFTEIYLDRYFNDKAGLTDSLNTFVAAFNAKWDTHVPIPAYTDDDLNKICFQNATGSGKTLIMHVNLLQYQHYAGLAGREDELSRVILLSPNERLSEQHLKELAQSAIDAEWFTGGNLNLFTLQPRGLRRVDVLEITKLADQDGPTTIATRSLGPQNLMLVDEGHRGMSATDEGAWFQRRNQVSEKGFVFEYSATFAQAVAAARNENIENSYAKCIIFDYSYRFFYEDGFGKDYQILNLSRSFEHTYKAYLVACLLKYYQQLRVYGQMKTELIPFNIEKPLWVFVGSSVVKASSEEEVVSDVGRILQFIADFLHDPQAAIENIRLILTGSGQDTGLLDENGNDIFAGSFAYLGERLTAGETPEAIYRDTLGRLFNNPAGGMLTLERIKGDSGEVALKAGVADEPFGLINVGDAAGLCKHCEEHCTNLIVTDSEFNEAMFSSVNESSSPVNLLIGSKKFVEGWDCWRVSTMGLMHVGRTEGAQIIQLFGRGVRLKGYGWSLKRSGYAHAGARPRFIEDVETLNVFGIEADFMEKFKQFLAEEGLPGNEQKQRFTIPLNVTYDFGKRLLVLRPRKKRTDGREYDFKKDGPVPHIGDIPQHLRANPVVADWYPRIQSIRSRGMAETGEKHRGFLDERHLALMDCDSLFFELERYKRDRTWHNINVSKAGILAALADKGWYVLTVPQNRLEPQSFDNARLWQEIALELLKKYCDSLYNYRKGEFIEPRLEYRPLTREDDLPTTQEYELWVDGSETQVIESIRKMQHELETSRGSFLHAQDLFACRFDKHLFQPLLHMRGNGRVRIAPVSLNESEYQFVHDLKEYLDLHQSQFEETGREVFLLRNLASAKGIGFFEARNFHPDFILWVLDGSKQYIVFLEPHGLVHEGPASMKIQFHQKVKEIEARLADPNVALESFILSWTQHARLDWGQTREQLERQHVLFMQEDQRNYVRKLFETVL